MSAAAVPAPCQACRNPPPLLNCTCAANNNGGKTVAAALMPADGFHPVAVSHLERGGSADMGGVATPQPCCVHAWRTLSTATSGPAQPGGSASNRFHALLAVAEFAATVNSQQGWRCSSHQHAAQPIRKRPRSAASTSSSADHTRDLGCWQHAPLPPATSSAHPAAPLPPVARSAHLTDLAPSAAAKRQRVTPAGAAGAAVATNILSALAPALAKLHVQSASAHKLLAAADRLACRAALTPILAELPAQQVRELDSARRFLAMF